MARVGDGGAAVRRGRAALPGASLVRVLSGAAVPLGTSYPCTRVSTECLEIIIGIRNCHEIFRDHADCIPSLSS